MDLSAAGALMARAQAGDRAAYDAVLRRCDVWVHRYLSRRLAPEKIDDVAQEVLLAVHEKRHTYDPSRPFGPWLAAIARYKWIDRVRRHYRTGEVELKDQGETGSHESAVLSAMVVERLLAALPDGQRDAVRLMKLEGRSVEEVSAATGQSASLVRVNVHRGLKRMLRALEKDDD